MLNDTQLTAATHNIYDKLRQLQREPTPQLQQELVTVVKQYIHEGLTITLRDSCVIVRRRNNA